MIFKCIVETTEIPDNCIKVEPMYKSVSDDEDIDWINKNASIIPEATCEFIYDLYCEAFKDKKVLTKNSFYALVRKQLSLKCKLMRLSQDGVKYCFFEK